MADDPPDYGRNVLPFTLHVNSQFEEAAPGGGSGNGGGMEARVARLESDVAHIKGRIDEIGARVHSISDKLADQKTDLAVLNTRSSHFATKTYSIVTAIAIVAALSGLILFAERLQDLLGIA